MLMRCLHAEIDVVAMEHDLLRERAANLRRVLSSTSSAARHDSRFRSEHVPSILPVTEPQGILTGSVATMEGIEKRGSECPPWTFRTYYAILIIYLKSSRTETSKASEG